ncbi:MAG TPA: glycoside hydrolase family 15 protein [Vicinamibacterales bacterium]|jgi:GH15 family glucan-1,4-alpha-glucosidase|nr:glycoside hydrolase family 15 protein [Vicinamibacterales bacterium]
MSHRLEDYALIGDCETAALLSRNGSIDWLCWPRFDSGACFAALLGSEEHGRWRLSAADPDARVTRAYRGDTLILDTRIETGDGVVTVTDFMPPRGRNSDVVRLVRGTSGRVAMRMHLVLRFDYGSTVPWVSRLADGTWRAIAGPDMVTLHTPVPLRGQDLTTVAEFEVDAGQTVPFVLTHGPSHLPPPHAIEPEESLRHTEKFWADWVDAKRLADGEWAGAVTRSLITLKALTYAPTGGMVAAPTTSLPEQIGGERNWDYRFCWVRDATYTLLALMNAGFHDEARAWREWLLRAAAGAPAQMQIMYGLAGERRLTEYDVDWLPGYERSRPVRIGNAAHGQLQLDVYGEVMDALHQAREAGLSAGEPDWALQRALLDHLAEVWRQPDQGLWEVRGDAHHFTYSKVMAWVAFERGVRAVKRFGLEGPLERWEALCRDIHAEVCAKAYDPGKGSFVQSYGSKELDASLLMLPMVGFLPADDPRVQGTIAAVERELLVDGFLLRYDTHSGTDGLPGGEGAFLACTFWLVDAYVLMRRFDDARGLFNRLLSLRNDVGLLSEEYDPVSRRLVGNFPQAFSHIALVNSAHNLAGARKPAEQRSAQPVPKDSRISRSA